MANDDGVVTDQDLLDHKPDDALAFLDIECLRLRLQPGEEPGERFGQAEIGGARVALVLDREQLGLRCLLSLPQGRHPQAQIIKRDQVFLVSGQQAVHALAQPNQIALQDFLPPLCRIRGARRGQPPIEFLLDQAGSLKQSDDLGPDDLIE